MFYVVLVLNSTERAMCTISLLYVAIIVCVSGTAADKALAEKGRVELQRLREFASHKRYGACWAGALEKVHANCRDFSEDTQSMMALAFTHCHLRRSGRSFPECPEGSSVKTCTRDMDPVAFNTYTEFFTHAHSICHYLQSEQWQHRAENTIHRLTESSAGVAKQLASTQRMAEDLVEAQSAALKSQETILRNGEELKTTLQHSAKGLRDVFAEMKHSVQEQQVAFAEIFNRVAFLQSFIMSESHTLSSLLYNALGVCASFLVTSTRRTSGARFFLFGLVALNVYLERLICKTVLEDDHPGYQQMERIAFSVGLLRKGMVTIACVVLLYFATRFRNANRESLEILRELKETHSNLQQTLRKAERLSGSLNDLTKPRQKRWGVKWDREEEHSLVILQPSGAIEATVPSFSSLHESTRRQKESFFPPLEAANTAEIPKRRQQRRSSGSRVHNTSALVYSVIVEDSHNQPRYSLRSRKSLCALEPKGERD